MTRGEIRKFCNETFPWKIDWITLFNHNELLIYSGSDHGKYIAIDKSDELMLGDYEGAIQFISDAVFTQQFSKRFKTQTAAISALSETVPSMQPITNAFFDEIKTNKFLSKSYSK